MIAGVGNRNALLLALLLTVACEREPAPSARSAPAGRLAVRTAERASAQVVGADTLSDSAHVLRVYPEADGDAVAFTFADPRRRVTSGLAITQRRAPTPALLWPDSVTAVWWSAPHALTFTTESGAGVRAVVDIHAERAAVSEGPARQVPPADPPVNSAALRRASAYVDSLRVQPGGRPADRSALLYRVTSLRMAPGGGLAAFYVTASGQSNPAWYALNVRTGAVAPIDEVTGPAVEMAEGAAGWTADGHFVYAKQLAIWEAEVRGEP